MNNKYDFYINPEATFNPYSEPSGTTITDIIPYEDTYTMLNYKHISLFHLVIKQEQNSFGEIMVVCKTILDAFWPYGLTCLWF